MTYEARYNLDTCSMLVEVSIGTWTARRLDRATSDEVVQGKHAASKDAARVNKHLLAGRPELDVISKHAGAVRTYVYGNTLPWSDSGLRLLPTLNFMKFEERVKEEEDKFWSLVSDFVNVYPSLITAQAMALGDMFDRNEYPAPGGIKEKFSFAVNYMPVPTAGDFRIDVGNEAQKELKEKLVRLGDERVERAMGDVKEKLRAHLERMVDRLTVDTVDGEAKPRAFHTSMLETSIELCDTLRSLNVVQDLTLEKARTMLERTIAGVSVKDLRESMPVRTNVRTQVQDILAKFQI